MSVQVTLKYLEPPEGQSDSEVVHAKFVLGADGVYMFAVPHVCNVC